MGCLFCSISSIFFFLLTRSLAVQSCLELAVSQRTLKPAWLSYLHPPPPRASPHLVCVLLGREPRTGVWRRALYQANCISIPLPFLSGQWTRLLLKISDGGIPSPYPAGLDWLPGNLGIGSTITPGVAFCFHSSHPWVTLGVPRLIPGLCISRNNINSYIDEGMAFFFKRPSYGVLASLQFVILLLQPKSLRRSLCKKLLACTSWTKSNPLTLAACFVPSSHFLSRVSILPILASPSRLTCSEWWWPFVPIVPIRDDSTLSSDPQELNPLSISVTVKLLKYLRDSLG